MFNELFAPKPAVTPASDSLFGDISNNARTAASPAGMLELVSLDMRQIGPNGMLRVLEPGTM